MPSSTTAITMSPLREGNIESDDVRICVSDWHEMQVKRQYIRGLIAYPDTAYSLIFEMTRRLTWPS
jgi:hypothetical protein